VYICRFSERQTPFHLSRCSSNSVNITTVQAVVEAVGCAGISQATAHGDDRFWKWKCKTFESVNFPYLRDKHPGLDADEVSKSKEKYHDTRSPRRFQKRQEDMDERLSGGRLNILTNTCSKTDVQSMRGYTTGCRYSGVPRPVNLDLKEDVPPPRPSDTPVIQIPIQSRPSPPRPSDTRVIQIPIQSRPILPHKAFGYSWYPDSDEVDHLEETGQKSNVRGKCL
jgi:hypothetical protein